MEAKQKEIIKLKKRLKRIEDELEKVRGCSPITHGWQTQRFAKSSRKWDMLAEEKRQVQYRIQELFDSMGSLTLS